MARPVVEPSAPLTAADKLRLSLDMFDYGLQRMFADLRRGTST